MRQVAVLIKSKKSLLRKTLGETMDDLVLEIHELAVRKPFLTFKFHEKR